MITVEESKVMWQLEKASLENKELSEPMQHLYSTVDDLIERGVITYDQFVKDIAEVIKASADKETGLCKDTESFNSAIERLILKYGKEENIEENGTTAEI